MVPPPWDFLDYSLRACSDHSHSHISRAQLWDLQKHNLIKWVAIRYRGEELAQTDNEPDVEKHWSGGVVKIAKVFGFRGTSSMLGAYLAAALRARESWALTMLEQMRCRRASEG